MAASPAPPGGGEEAVEEIYAPGMVLTWGTDNNNLAGPARGWVAGDMVGA